MRIFFYYLLKVIVVLSCIGALAMAGRTHILNTLFDLGFAIGMWYLAKWIKSKVVN